MTTHAGRPAGFGGLLRHWRGVRRRSQLDLALEADVSTRHLSFLETGRSNPSREMVLRLARVLEVPLREQNALLEAAGFAPAFEETPLSGPQMAQVRRVLEQLLERLEPYSAVVVDGAWDVVLANRPHERLLEFFLEEDLEERTRKNLARLLFDPAALRPFVTNWEEVASAVLGRLHRQAAGRPDGAAGRLLEEILADPELPESWRVADFDEPPRLVIPIRLRKDDLELGFFSAITTLGAPRDVTLQELQVEMFLPVDAATEATLREIHRA